MSKKCLIVEGGGFKTGFTAGVLDSFLLHNYYPFDSFLGVSGGTISLSYFLSKQYRSCLEAIRFMATNENFLNARRILAKEGYMDIDFMAQVANKEVPFDIDAAILNTLNKSVYFVATNRNTGQAKHIVPNISNWIDANIASCTLPFVTKGEHKVNDQPFFDGGWSDPLPVEFAYERGMRDIIVVRTCPKTAKSAQSWPDYFGSLYHKSDSPLGRVFANAHLRYNESVDFILNPPSDCRITQIAPEQVLESGTYSYSEKSITNDYRNGLDEGMQFLTSISRKESINSMGDLA